MKKHILMSLILVASVANVASAAEEKSQNTNSNEAKMSDLKNKEQKESDLDSEITNARMRAEAGSKAKWSVKANLDYQGGSAEKPFDKIRPNYRKGSATQDLTFLSGTIGMAYRVSEKEALRLGAGISMLTPFHNTLEDMKSNQLDGSATDKIFNISTPYIQYSRNDRVGSVMHMPSVTYSHSTEQYYAENLKNIGAVSFSHTMVMDVAGSNFQPGLVVAGDYSIYKDAAQSYDIFGSSNARSDYSLLAIPFLEYSFNDKYSFRTVFGYFSYSHYRSEEATELHRLASYQSMGLGISISRDIYLYPNVQFIPDDICAERTNVGVSSTLNVF